MVAVPIDAIHHNTATTGGTAGSAFRQFAPIKHKRSAGGNPIDTWGDQHFTPWARALSPEQQWAFSVWRTPGQYYGINYLARHGRLHPNHFRHSRLTVDDLHVITKNLDEALSATKLPEGVVCYRAMALPAPLQQRLDQGRIVGESLCDPGFTCATLDSDYVQRFAWNRRRQGHQPCIIEIHAPAGIRAGYVETALRWYPANPHGRWNEHELLFARNTTLHFTRASQDAEGTWRLVATVTQGAPVRAADQPTEAGDRFERKPRANMFS